jgi:hypothetical protein
MNDDERYAAWIDRLLMRAVEAIDRDEFYAETGEEPYGMQEMWGDADFAGQERGAEGLS